MRKTYEDPAAWCRRLRDQRKLSTRAASLKSTAAALFRAGHTVEADRLVSEAESYLRERARIDAG